ncbi:hypothetical protein, partial [Burkholderia stagnalis]|uniref:hypothetical protein n=1 Tax=Burkholderia stagnalis TaxID=1503054 RepID=UPI001E2BC969
WITFGIRESGADQPRGAGEKLVDFPQKSAVFVSLRAQERNRTCGNGCMSWIFPFFRTAPTDFLKNPRCSRRELSGSLQCSFAGMSVYQLARNKMLTCPGIGSLASILHALFLMRGVRKFYI